MRYRVIFRAIGISLIINCGLALSAFLNDTRKPSLVLLRRIAEAIAAPLGVIINTFGAPHQHTFIGFMYGMAGALLFSIVFYAVVAWCVMQLVAYLRSVAAQKSVGPDPS